MRKQRLPPGWDAASIRQLAAEHDNQSDEDQAKEIEAALVQEGQTVMVVPTELVPKIHQLILRRKRPA